MVMESVNRPDTAIGGSGAGSARRPWADVGTGVVSALEQSLQPAIDATIEAIGREVPSYADFGSGPLATTVRRGVEIALARLIALMGRDEAALEPQVRRVYERIGAGEWANGRSLDALLAAYRTGARVAWEQMSAATLAAGAQNVEIVSLAEAIFVYIDELSAASVAGYADAQVADAGRRESVRTRLAELILDGAGESDTAMALAEQIGWSAPGGVAVAIGPGDGDRWPPVAAGGQALVVAGDRRWAVVPTWLARADTLVDGERRTVVVGSSEALADAPNSLRSAMRLVKLVAAGVVASPLDGLIRAEDYLLELAVTADPASVARLHEELFSALSEVSDERRDALLRTLLAWLLTGGDRVAAAALLHVHPQTISYRLARLRDFLGDDLDEPRRRAEMVITLTAAYGVHR